MQRHRIVGMIGVLAAAGFLIPSGASGDQVILDDLIVDGSICVGQDCVNGESFGFDTLRLKENNLRIRAVDTSSTSSFPSRDWQITFNDSANGGANKFSIDDIDGGRTPFTLEAGAPSHSLYVDDGGRLGLGTSTPVADVHVKSGNTPTLRLEQDGSSGFTPQTWDVAGNEANFFVRDATNGSTLPFRIHPGADTNGLVIDANGTVGFGTNDPDGQLNLSKTNANFMIDGTGGGNSGAAIQLRDGNENNRSTLARTFSTHSQGIAQDRFQIDHRVGGSTVSVVVMDNDGDVGIGNGIAVLDHDFEIQNGLTGSEIDAGETAFVATSSRTLKENIEPVETGKVLDRVAAVPVVTYDWKKENFSGSEDSRTDKMGLIAEDFHTIWQRGSDKKIRGQEVQMTLWLAVQELHAENKKLVEKVERLEQAISDEEK